MHGIIYGNDVVFAGEKFCIEFAIFIRDDDLFFGNEFDLGTGEQFSVQVFDRRRFGAAKVGCMWASGGEFTSRFCHSSVA